MRAVSIRAMTVVLMLFSALVAGVMSIGLIAVIAATRHTPEEALMVGVGAMLTSIGLVAVGMIPAVWVASRGATIQLLRD